MKAFDKARYAQLLKGLEISVLNMSSVSDLENPTMRFGAHPFS